MSLLSGVYPTPIILAYHHGRIDESEPDLFPCYGGIVDERSH